MAELEEKAKQLALDMAVDLLQPQICEDAREPEAESKDEPVDEDTGTLNPFEIFPDLVWLKIGSKLQDKHDWLNLYFSSPKLMDFLQNEMIERIFPQVFPHLRKYLKRKDVINLCAANRKFGTAIISWVQTKWLAPRWTGEGYDEPSKHYDRNYYEYLANKIPEYSPIVKVEIAEQIQVITNELLEGGSGSLIPFGIVFSEWVAEVEFWASVKTFLQLFGKRIWFCKFISDTRNWDPTQFLDTIIQCMRLIPNVNRLGLIFPYLIPPANSPRCPYLVKLKELSLIQKSHETFIDFLRLHSNQLEYLSIGGKHNPEEAFGYSNLKTLRLTPSRPFEFPRDPMRLDLFSHAKLTKIYTEVTATGFTEFGRRFLQLNILGASLEVLELQVDIDGGNFFNREQNDMSWTRNINLPKLKKFTIWSYGTGLHLLLRMHSFQDTHFPFPMDWLFSGNMNKNIFKSNIWSKLSNLEEVKLCNWRSEQETCIFTRQQYNEYHEDPLNFRF